MANETPEQPLDARRRLGQYVIMYTSVTHDIRVVVEPEFLRDRSEPERGRYFWAYRIEITNLGHRTAQLTYRHWRITDANGRLEEVRGPGVVGEQPTLRPGETFHYTSGCPLTTPSGIMVGSYLFVDEAGEKFEVEVPAFSLDSPHAKRILN